MKSLARKELEVLSPAGNQTCLTAALKAGADAVFFGVEAFNMRARANNFTNLEMAEVAGQAHDYGAKAYLTANTIVYEDELLTLDQTMEAAKLAGLDGIIAWDMAVILAARKHGLPVMFSTQASISNSTALQYYHKELGIQRFVLARECTLEQIRSIRQALDDFGMGSVELEAFAHGAMCVAVSGRCFMSYENYGKSANRGECMQPCRKDYTIASEAGGTAVEFDLGRDYVMSPKDLCTLPFIEQLIDAGIHSFKIEGRNRNPEYVSLTTAAYRRVIDFYVAHSEQSTDAWQAEFAMIKAEEMERLGSVYHRGFSNGFYHGKPVDDWSEVRGSAATSKKQSLGTVLNYFKKSGIAHIRIETNELQKGDEILIQGPTTGSVTVVCDSMLAEQEAIATAHPGEAITLPVAQCIRRGDRVYRRVSV